MEKGSPKRDLLFKKTSPISYNFGMIAVSDYNPETGIYATLKLENNNGKKLKVVWIKL